MVFYENDRSDLSNHRNRRLYVNTSIREVELKRAMLELGSSADIISLPVLDTAGVPRTIFRGSRSRC